MRATTKEPSEKLCKLREKSARLLNKLNRTREISQRASRTAEKLEERLMDVVSQIVELEAREGML
jgi:hypothetical protein